MKWRCPGNGIVVALLRACHLIAAADHRNALTAQQRREHVAHLLLPQVVDVLDGGRAFDTPQFQERLLLSPSLLPSPLASLCFSL